MRVLVVDDLRDERKILRITLERQGFQVIEAADGQEGLEMAAAEKPDIIISDALMPRMDGFEFLRNAKKDEKLRSIPFIFYSAVYSGYKDAELANSLGAEAFIVRPKEPLEFWRELNSVLERCRRSKEAKAPAAGIIEKDEEYLRQYSQIVALKLEEKVRELAESQRAYRTLAENLPGIVYRVQLQGKHRRQFFNRVAESITGYSDRELGGGEPCALEKLILPEDRNRAIAEVKRAVAEKRPYSLEYRLRHKDGRICFILDKGTPIYGDDGKPLCVEGVLFDITREREIDRMKDEFISTAAHELRTPLTAVMGYLELLIKKADAFAPEERKEFLTLVYQQSEALARIINDLLDLSHVQSGRLITLKRSYADFGALVGRAVAVYQGISDRHRFRFEFPPVPVDLCIDQGKIGQVLDNLLSNAVKFSPAGGTIQVTGVLTDGEFEVVIADEGIGMGPEQVAHIFDKFYRADRSDTAVSGLGLGMSIVRNIVESHGGRIWVESEPGRGTRVHFTVPREERAPQCALPGH